MSTKSRKSRSATPAGTEGRNDREFLQVVRRHLAYRDDPALEDFIRLHEHLTWMPQFPHENSMAVVVRQLRECAKRDTPMVVEGPLGSGRYSVAQVIRDLDRGTASQWVVLPCPGIQATRLKSVAPNSCLILKELDKSDSDFQLALLGLLDETNSARPRRIVCTTSRDLNESVKDGSFDPLLLQRLALGTKIIIPPLASRRWDIPIIIVSTMARIDPGRTVTLISYAALDLLVNFEWAGGVAELIAVIEDAVRRVRGSKGNTITLSIIGDYFKRATPVRREPTPIASAGEDDLSLLQRVGSDELRQFFQERYRKGAYSTPSNDREWESGGWGQFDPELWTGCYLLILESSTAWEFYRYVKDVESDPSRAWQDAAQPTLQDMSTAGVEQQANLEYERKRYSEFERLRLQVQRIKLRDDYGTHPHPRRSEVGNVTTIELRFSPYYVLLTSPKWLADENWRLRDSWRVPLEWADTRVLFDVKRMADDMSGFLRCPPRERRSLTNVAADNVSVAQSPSQPKERTNQFLDRGETFEIRFAERSATVKARLGFRYLSILLREPGVSVGARDLVAMEKGEILSSASPAELVDMEKSSLRGGALIDGRTREQVEAEIALLKTSAKKAEKDGDLDEAQRLDQEIANHEEYLSAAGNRAFRDDHVRARDSVSRAIRTALERIKRLHPELHRHLMPDSLTFGSKLRYNPIPLVVWETSLPVPPKK